MTSTGCSTVCVGLTRPQPAALARPVTAHRLVSGPSATSSVPPSGRGSVGIFKLGYPGTPRPRLPLTPALVAQLVNGHPATVDPARRGDGKVRDGEVGRRRRGAEAEFSNPLVRQARRALVHLFPLRALKRAHGGYEVGVANTGRPVKTAGGPVRLSCKHGRHGRAEKAKARWSS